MNLLGNTSVPNYIKLMAAVLLSATYLAALGIAVDTYVTQGVNASLPPAVTLVLGTGLGMTINILGIHQGATLQESGTNHASPPSS